MHPNGRLTVVGIEAHGAGFHAGALGGVEEEASSAGEALAGPTARALLTAPVAAPAPPSAAVLKEAQGTVAHTCPTARDGGGGRHNSSLEGVGNGILQNIKYSLISHRKGQKYRLYLSLWTLKSCGGFEQE